MKLTMSAQSTMPMAPAARLARTLARNTLAAALALPLLLPGHAYADPAPQPPSVPSTTIQVEPGHIPYLVGHAKGTQNYSCQPSSTSPSGYAWTFVAPKADLFDDRGKLIITHFGGPTWQARDGSSVKATRVDGITVDTNAIQWLLLQATSPTEGPGGADRLTDTTFIQRVNTVGGLAPDSGCDAAHVGDPAQVSYTADYYFYKKATS